jgi:SMI1-KNR4 cell-wall
MKIRLTQLGPRLSTTALHRLEAALGNELPGAYLRFLSKQNGGTALGHCFRFSGRTSQRYYVNEFLSATKSTRGPLSILEMRAQWNDGIPSDTIPIAIVSGEYLLLLRISGARRGHVDLKVTADVENWTDPEDGIVPVAKSFPEFLKMLDFIPEEELDEDEYGLW